MLYICNILTTNTENLLASASQKIYLNHNQKQVDIEKHLPKNRQVFQAALYLSHI